ATTEKCPECGGTLIRREGRRGKFLGCSNFPKCRYTRDYGGEELAGEAADEAKEAPPAEAAEADEEPDSDRVPVTCDKCGAPMVVRRGRRGRFLGCSNYPRCKATKPLGAAIEAGWTPPEAEILDEKCPQCGKPLAIREGRRGKFIGCTGYPACRYTRDLGGEEEGGDAD
ncbi:MAG: topoisomerase DNA-binding C4 zinc finger domain-containing protein, partial [Armatimonadota bacterium]